MRSLLPGALVVLALAPVALTQTTYTWQSGQFGYNGCSSAQDGQSSDCQTAVMNSLDDFCLFGPPTPNQSIGDSEREEVAWCTQAGHGTRVIPSGTIISAHWRQTPNFIQVTGTGNFVNINIAASDTGGGELDPHGADGLGNPIGGIVTYNGVAIPEWSTFISSNEFCFRICPAADDAWLWCQHYDLEGCMWNNPGNYDSGFDTCDADSGEYPGIYVADGVTSTYSQGTDENNPTPAPAAHTVPASSNCVTISTIGTDSALLPAPTVYGSSVAANSSSLASSSGSNSSSSSTALSSSTLSSTAISSSPTVAPVSRITSTSSAASSSTSAKAAGASQLYAGGFFAGAGALVAALLV